MNNMIKLLSLVVFISAVSVMFANQITISTPEGSVSIQVSNSSHFDGSGTHTGAIVDNIGSKLEELDKNYLSKLSRLDRTRAEKMLAEIFALLTLIPTDTAVSYSDGFQTSVDVSMLEKVTMPPPIEQVLPAEPVVISEQRTEVVKTPMSDSDFRRFQQNIESESFSDNQLNVIRLAARNNWFSVDQIIKIIGLLSFSEDQISALEILYLRVTDPQNSHNIPNAFTFSEDKEEAAEIISR